MFTRRCACRGVEPFIQSVPSPGQHTAEFVQRRGDNLVSQWEGCTCRVHFAPRRLASRSVTPSSSACNASCCLGCSLAGPCRRWGTPAKLAVEYLSRLAVSFASSRTEELTPRPQQCSMPCADDTHPQSPRLCRQRRWWPRSCRPKTRCSALASGLQALLASSSQVSLCCLPTRDLRRQTTMLLSVHDLEVSALAR